MRRVSEVGVGDPENQVGPENFERVMSRAVAQPPTAIRRHRHRVSIAPTGLQRNVAPSYLQLNSSTMAA
jgi:hypothetical protein